VGIVGAGDSTAGAGPLTARSTGALLRVCVGTLLTAGAKHCYQQELEHSQVACWELLQHYR